MRTMLLMAGLVLLAEVAAFSNEIPPREIPQGVGVNIHFVTGHEKDLDMIAAAGFKWVRMDFTWEGIEHQKGMYDWSGYEQLTANLEKRGMKAIYILDYSHHLYEDVVRAKNPITGKEHEDLASPQKPEAVAAFAKWAAASAEHFKGRPIIWEIFNEPNITFWKPKPDVKQYTALALAVCKAIHEKVPDASIIGPATSGIPVDFIEEFLKSGVLKDLSGLSVHPYRNYSRSPETAVEDYAKLWRLLDKYAPKKGEPLPVISGEWGYATEEKKGVSLEKQAQFAVRQQLVNVANNVPISIWYDWKNDGPDAAEREHNFGTVTMNLEPKPAYKAIQTLTRELNGMSPSERLEAANEKDYLLVLKDKDGNQKLAAWTAGEERDARVNLMKFTKEAALPTVSMFGEEKMTPLENGMLRMHLSGAVEYFRLGKALK